STSTKGRWHAAKARRTRGQSTAASLQFSSVRLGSRLLCSKAFVMISSMFGGVGGLRQSQECKSVRLATCGKLAQTANARSKQDASMPRRRTSSVSHSMAGKQHADTMLQGASLL